MVDLARSLRALAKQASQGQAQRARMRRCRAAHAAEEHEGIVGRSRDQLLEPLGESCSRSIDARVGGKRTSGTRVPAKDDRRHLGLQVQTKGGAGQPKATIDEKKERSVNLYNADKLCTLKRSEENPLMDKLYEGILKGREHELLHVSYVK